MESFTKFGLAGTAIVLLGASTQALAQDAAPAAAAPDTGITEVIITASRQGATKVQATPIAITAFSANQLDKSFANNIKDLVQMTPNLNIAQVTASASIYIRGIGTNAVFNGSDPDVAVNVDGVYMARAFAQFTDFVDIDRIEVLRGPQGTLYGRNAVGGVINIITRKPGDEVAGQAQVTIGDYGALQTQGYISGPLVKGVLNGSIAVNYQRHDAYTRNLVTSRPGLGNANRGGVRAQLLWKPTDDIEAITRVDWAHVEENIQAYDQILAPLPFAAPLANSAVGEYHTVAQNNPQDNNETLEGISEDVNFRLSDHMALRSITAYRHSTYTVHTDTDASELTVNNALQHDNSTQFSQEFNLTGNIGATDYVLGLYYFREHEESINQGFVPPSIFTPSARALVNRAHPTTVATSKAIFAQVTQHLTPSLSLIVGARYTEDTKKLDLQADRWTYTDPPTLGAEFAGFPFTAHLAPNFHAFTPKLGLNWQMTKDNLFYASYARGFKSGGNNFAATSLVGITYKPEQITSLEAGVKTSWLERKLRLNLTVFDYDYTNLQVQSLIGPGNTQIANAASARVKGVEFESIAQVTPNLTLTANLSVLDARYKKFTGATVPGGLVSYLASDPRYTAATRTYDATGNRLNAAPKQSASFSAQYNQPLSDGTLFYRAEYYWQDRIYYDPSNAPIVSQAAYGLTNLSIGYNANGPWSVQLGVKNLFDKGYFITMAANGTVPSGLSGPPRTAMLRLTRRY